MIVFGGTPPYQVSQPSAFNVFPTVLSASGDRFTVQPTGTCVDSAQIAIVDANGSSTTIIASNKASTNAAPAGFAVAPASVTLTSCSDVANVALTGGNGAYNESITSGPLAATAFGSSASGGQGTISMRKGTDTAAPLGAGPYNVVFSDGQSSATVAVTLTGAALNGCPT